MQNLEKKILELRYQIPNVPQASVPAGNSEEDNEELDYAKESSILNPYFIAFRNNALKSEFLPVLRDFFKKLV